MQIDDWLMDILACPNCHAPLRADEAASEWMNNDLDLNECARNGIRTFQIANAVVVEAGLGDGLYKVEARYEDLGKWGNRIAEVRIKFLPHPQLEADA